MKTAVMRKYKYIDYYDILPKSSGFFYENYKIIKNIKELDIKSFNLLWTKEYNHLKDLSDELSKLDKKRRVIKFGYYIKSLPADEKEIVYKDLIGFRNFIFKKILEKEVKEVFRYNYDDIHFTDTVISFNENIKPLYVNNDYLEHVKYKMYKYVVVVSNKRGIFFIDKDFNITEKYSNYLSIYAAKELISIYIKSILSNTPIKEIQYKILEKLNHLNDRTLYIDPNGRYISNLIDNSSTISELKYFYNQYITNLFYPFLLKITD